MTNDADGCTDGLDRRLFALCQWRGEDMQRLTFELGEMTFEPYEITLWGRAGGPVVSVVDATDRDRELFVVQRERDLIVVNDGAPSEDIIEAIDQATGCQLCGRPLGRSPSDDFCGAMCQQQWHTRHHQAKPLTGYVDPWYRPWEFPGVGEEAAIYTTGARRDRDSESNSEIGESGLIDEIGAYQPITVTNRGSSPSTV